MRTLTRIHGYALMVLLVTGLANSAFSQALFVREGGPYGTGDGSSWSNAYGDLQDALDDVSSSGADEIWVAAGTYKPSAEVGGTGDRYKTFQLKNGVAMYGGFGGTEDPATFDLDERDFVANETILTGDLLDNDDPNTHVEDLPGDPARADNCYHVLYHPSEVDVNSTAVLDGFTVAAGNANGDGGHSYGGGMYNDDASPTVTNCTFVSNTASRGGGMFNAASSPSVTNSAFTCNSATLVGAGMVNYSSSPTVNNCFFSVNYTDGSGGGMGNLITSSPVVTSCTFSDNHGYYGGGICNDVSSSPTVTNCIFAGNYDGGIANYNSSPAVTNCVFSKNTAYEGGAMQNYSSSAVVVSCSFSGNTTDDGNGGGIYNSGSSIAIRNCILWNNSAAGLGNEIYNDASTATIAYSDIKDSGGSSSWDTDLGTDEGGNIDADPLFEDADANNLRLTGGSPCIDAGDNSVVLELYDLDGVSRIIDGDSDGTATTDMGAYEYHDEVILYVNGSLTTGNNTGASWENAFTNLQDALDAASTTPDVNQIRVAAGVYYPTDDYGLSGDDPDRLKHFEMVNGVAIYGGFPDTGNPGMEDRDPALYATILSGDIGVEGDRNDNCYHVFYLPSGGDFNSTAILDGVTVSGGNADGPGSHSSGGGMYNYGGSPDLKNCIFADNTADEGGGIYNRRGITITNCTFRNNTAGYSGGGVYHSDPCDPCGVSSSYDLTITSCIFSDNTADGSGGGICNYGAESVSTITDCIFTGNSAGNGGGVILSYEISIITNCVFAGNHSSSKGGGILAAGDHSKISNCTLVGNSAEDAGGGLCSTQAGEPNIVNCIFWANKDPNGVGAFGSQIYNDGGSALVTYCDIQGGYPGDNIDDDPLFVDPGYWDPNGTPADTSDDLWVAGSGNYRLTAISPCVDTGDNTVVTEPNDLDGSNRIADGDSDGTATVDMGAYEYQLLDFGDAPTAAQSGFSNDYPTTLALDGARHAPGCNLWFGHSDDDPDPEADGQPDPNALGDDDDDNDDENGVVIPTLEADSAADITIYVYDPNHLDGHVEIWIDWNADGDWNDPNELVFSGIATEGENLIQVMTPGDASAGKTFARCRISSLGTGSPLGYAPDGEVEDHILEIVAAPDLDFGDAPTAAQSGFSNDYPTLNGARHKVTGGYPRLGSSVDAEPDGQPDPDALGDDNNGDDDEDGVTIPLLVEENTSEIEIEVEAGTPDSAYVDFWIDWDADGNWNDTDEHVYSDFLDDGYNTISVTPPPGSAGMTFARCRINSSGQLGPDGYASDGEVEDYTVEIAEPYFDFGDAPTAAQSGFSNDYPTTLALDGARHLVTGGPSLRRMPFGKTTDSEPDGQPDADALGDDNSGLSDEDGVLIPTLIQEDTAGIIIYASDGGGVVQLWIDWNGNGSWDDPGDFVYDSVAPVSGVIGVPVPVPPSPAGTTYARCRISSQGTGSPYGWAPDGEVEDHMVEIAPAPIIYVDASATTGSNNGSSWDDAYTNLQSALSIAAPGQEIWVAAGTYKPTAPGGDRTISFQLKSGVELYGGFPAGGGIWEDRNHASYETVLSGDLNGDDDADGISDNSYTVVNSSGTDPNTILDGFTISNGNANDSGAGNEDPEKNGGGVYNVSGSPMIRNCTIKDNNAHYRGGGMYNYDDSHPVIDNCVFQSNSATNGYGGGIYNGYNGSSVTLINSRFINNSAVQNGALVNGSDSVSQVINCVFSGNSASDKTGAISNSSSVSTFVNCSIVGNSAANIAGGIRNRFSDVSFYNCIIWGNTAPLEPQILTESGDVVFANCDISDCNGSGINWDTSLGSDGEGNIDADPLFVDADGDDDLPGTDDDNLRMLFNSPCTDAGDNTVVTESDDLDGRDRIVDGDCSGTATVDMGAYEFSGHFIGDYVIDCTIDNLDLAALADAWLTDNTLIDIAPPGGDGITNFRELAVIAQYWLTTW